MGFVTLKTRDAANQMSGVISRSFSVPDALTGSSPVSRPESQVACSLAASMAISAPEFPAPTTSVSPGSSCERLR